MIDKNQLRAQLRAHRRDAAAKHADASVELLAQFKTISLPTRAIVAGYVAIKDEINPAPVMEFLAAQGMKLCLPVMEYENSPLTFHAYQLGDALDMHEPYAIPQPIKSESVIPHILLIPLLGFDRAGNRIGYGKGYYDRTLEQLRTRHNITAIGLAYAEQEVDHINAAPHDQRLNIVVTPRETIYGPAL